MKKRANRAVAVVMVLGLLLVMSMMGVTFVKYSSMQRNSAVNYQDLIRARLLADAGLSRAIHELRSMTLEEMACSSQGPWIYYGEYKWQQNSKYPLEKANYPSFWWPVGAAEPDTTSFYGRAVSGFVNTPHGASGTYEPHGDTYILKVVDVSGQLWLNHPGNDPANIYDNNLIPMLVHLGEAIAEEDGSTNLIDLETARKIIELRHKLGNFSRKEQLLKVLSPEQYEQIAEYVTPYGIPNPATMSPDVRSQPRVPVNINSAPRPVLIALLEGLSSRNGITISASQARDLADAIITCRNNYENGIRGWLQFDFMIQFFVNQGLITAAQGDLIKANANPNVYLKRFNPDRVVYCGIDKSDLDYYTTEFCFMDQAGHFEITSLGRITANGGQVRAQCKIKATVRIHGFLREMTQTQFESDAGDIEKTAAWCNNVDDSTTNNLMGYVQLFTAAPTSFPGHTETFKVLYNIPLSEVSTAEGSGSSSGSESGSSSGSSSGSRQGWSSGDSIWARKPGGPDASSGNSSDNQESAFSPEVAAGSSAYGGRLSVNEPLIAGGNLARDGILLREEENRELFYYSRHNLPLEEGTLMFWFKCNESQEASPTTIFFADSPEITGVNGVQTEIRMAVNDTDGLSLRVRRYFYVAADEPDSERTEYHMEESIRESVVATVDPADPETEKPIARVRLHEWHHLAISWHNYVDIKVYIDGQDIVDHSEAQLEQICNDCPGPWLDMYAGFGPYHGRFYLGGLPSSLSNTTDNIPYPYISPPEPTPPSECKNMTLDDLRVFQDNTVMRDYSIPERFEPMNEVLTVNGKKHVCMGTYNGAFDPAPEDVTLGAISWTVRIPTEYGGHPIDVTQMPNLATNLNKDNSSEISAVWGQRVGSQGFANESGRFGEADPPQGNGDENSPLQVLIKNEKLKYHITFVKDFTDTDWRPPLRPHPRTGHNVPPFFPFPVGHGHYGHWHGHGPFFRITAAAAATAAAFMDQFLDEQNFLDGHGHGNANGHGNGVHGHLSHIVAQWFPTGGHTSTPPSMPAMNVSPVLESLHLTYQGNVKILDYKVMR